MIYVCSCRKRPNLISKQCVDGRPNKFEDKKRELLIDENCFQIQDEFLEYLRISKTAIWKRLKAAGYSKKQRSFGNILWLTFISFDSHEKGLFLIGLIHS